MPITTGSWWTPAERHDREYASDRYSRYGGYLAARVQRAVADDEVADPAGWTAWCWRVAARPVMAPGYVVEADPIKRTSLWRNPDGGGLGVTLVTAAPPPPGIGRRWRTWHIDVRDRLSYRAEPRALTRIEFETILAEPQGGWAPPPRRLPWDRRELVGLAKGAVIRAAVALNTEFAEPLAVLTRGLGLDRRRGADLARG